MGHLACEESLHQGADGAAAVDETRDGRVERAVPLGLWSVVDERARGAAAENAVGTRDEEADEGDGRHVRGLRHGRACVRDVLDVVKDHSAVTRRECWS